MDARAVLASAGPVAGGRHPSRLHPALLAVLAVAGQRWAAWTVFGVLLFSAGLSGPSILDMIGPMLLWPLARLVGEDRPKAAE